MLANTDWAGIAAVIVALGTSIPAIIAAIYAAKANKNTRAPNGGPPLGEQINNVAAAVSTPPGVAPLGQIASDVVDTVEELHNVVTGNTPPGGTKI